MPNPREDLPYLDLDAIDGDGPTLGQLLSTPQDRWSRDLRRMAMRLLECVRHVVNELAGPGTRLYPLIRLYPGFSDDERMHAVDQLVKQMPSSHRDLAVKKKLRQIAEEGGTSVKMLLRTQYFPEALILAAGGAFSPQRIRVGRTWIRRHGRDLVVPAEFPITCLDLFERWLFQNAFREVSVMVLEHPSARRSSDPLDHPKLLVPLVEETVPGERWMPDRLMEAREEQALLDRVETTLSPRHRQLWRLIMQDGVSFAEAARDLQVSPSRISQMWRQIHRHIERRLP